MKILIFCIPGIGDALMATPMIKFLKKNKPLIQIDIACMFDAVSYIFDHNPYINNCYKLSLYRENRISGLFQILSLRKKNYDVSILAFPAFRREYHLAQWLVNAPIRVSHSFNKGYLSEFNFLDTHRIKVDEKEHNVINNLNLLKPLGINWKENMMNKKNIAYDLIVNRKDKKFGENYLNNLGWSKKNIVGLHPGSINSKAGISKRWSIDNFAKLTDYLIEKNRKIIIFVGPGELKLGKIIFNLIKDKKNCHLVNNLKFNLSIGILSCINLLVSNDNGFAHVANSLKVKTITLFGPTNPLWCAPYDSSLSINIRKTRSYPWFGNDTKVTSVPRGVGFEMDKIKLKDVIAVIERQLVD